MDWKNILERAAWTFVQAFTSSLAAAAWLNIDALQAAAIAGGSALLSFLKTLAQERLAAKNQPVWPV